MTPRYLSYLFKGPVSKSSHILRCWGLAFQHKDLEVYNLAPSHYLPIFGKEFQNSQKGTAIVL